MATPASKPPSRPLVGQPKVIDEVRRKVDRWRGFPLGAAGDPYPLEPPRYDPVDPGDRPITGTTRTLLQHWFRSEPHWLGPDGNYAFKYWPHQRRAVETFIYLYEVAGIRRTEALYELAEVEVIGPQRDPWTKLGGNLATGSGKTKMMSLLIAWGYLNAVCEGEEALGIGKHALLIAPVLFVRDRLLLDFLPPDGSPSVFFSDPVVPPELESYWRLKVYSPTTCPLVLDPEEGALVVTNYHQLMRTREDAAELPAQTSHDRQMDLLFEDAEPSRLEAIQSPLIERFRKSRGLMVLNDEAHHVWDETGHARFEQRQRDKLQLGQEGQEAMAWIRAIRNLNGSVAHPGRVALQIDMSATLFEEAGTKPKASAKTEFRVTDMFRHTVVHYGLAEAIRDGIVKWPVLERIEVKDKATGQAEPLIRQGQPNAWETYRNLLLAGIERWRKVRDQLRAEGDKRKPILFLLCEERRHANEIANYLAHGQAIAEPIEGEPTGFVDPDSGELLFVETGPDGQRRSTVIEIHIGEKERSNEAEWDKVRASVNAIDREHIQDPSGAVDEDGRPIMLPNPYNVVVSVMMLKEGWDVRNVKVIVPLRPCDSRTLTEQTLGRGLRKMHAPVLDDDGRAEMRREDLYVIEHPSFAAVLDQIDDLVDRKDSDDIDHGREYVGIDPQADAALREATSVPLLRFEGLTQVPADWRKSFDLKKVPALSPRLGWMEKLAETEIRTFLKEALKDEEADGHVFTFGGAPSFRDFDHVLEVAYATPLLREMRASYQHKTALKGVCQQFLEQKTFALPAGLPLAFDRLVDSDGAAIALGNLARPEVIAAVRKALGPAVQEAVSSAREREEAMLARRRSADLQSYQAIKRHVLDGLKRSSFARAAFDSADELRVARLLEDASDVAGWVFNHRGGVGHAIEYDWQGYTARYYPDFIVRARLGEVVHNVIIEVKGRLDDRDKKKARRGRDYCELLSQHDGEPWHYLLLVENKSDGREDITEWEKLSARELGQVLKRHEVKPLYPEHKEASAGPSMKVLDDVGDDEKWNTALPVLDLSAEAGGFGPGQDATIAGWMKVQSSRRLDVRMFVTRINGKSMEPGVHDGAWVLLRKFEGGTPPMATALDGRRVIVQLREGTDPETGGQYTLKRWKVTKVDEGGGAVEIELRPDNGEFKARRYGAASDLRAVAELLEVLD